MQNDRGRRFLRRGATLKKDWTQGSIIGNLLLLSWPMVGMEMSYVVGQIVDMIWVGKLGPSSIAGLGLANIVIMIVISMHLGLTVGVRAVVARYAGAGDIRGANYAAGQAFIIITIWGALVTVTGIFLAEPIISLFGVEDEVVAEGTAFMRIMFAGWVTLEVLVMGLYTMQSSGDTLTPLMIEIVTRIVHVTLCPFLVLGWWVFPRLGISGAALSNVVCQAMGVVLVFWVLFGGRTRLHLTLRDFRLNYLTIWRILRISIPVLVMNLQRSFGSFVLTWLIAPFGTIAVAAHSLAARVEMLLSMPSMALGMGAGVLVGQNIGSGQPERAGKNAWVALGFVEAFMVTCSVVILLWAENIMGVFTTDPGLVEVGSIFLRIATAGYMIVSIAVLWVVQLPLAFFLPRVTNLGVYGLRWALVAGTFVGAIAYTTYFRLGRWKTKKV
jgi:putative MATE family efflux protein